MAFKECIALSDNGPLQLVSTFSEGKSREKHETGSSEGKFREEHGTGFSEGNSREEHETGSSVAIGSKISSTFVLASDLSVKAKFSVQNAGISTVSVPPVTSTIWPEGNKTENERLISSFADRLTLTDEVAILSESLKKNKENLKVLCSNSNLPNAIFKYSLTKTTF